MIIKRKVSVYDLIVSKYISLKDTCIKTVMVGLFSADDLLIYYHLALFNEEYKKKIPPILWSFDLEYFLRSSKWYFTH